MRKTLLLLALASLAIGADTRPKVRAITAFINIDPKTSASDVETTVQFLKSARESYRRAGFEVETIRIVTQPFPRYTAAMKRADAIALLRKLDELAAKSGFAPNIGTAMVGGW
jgi:uncharacterized protein (UPF0210 family)